MVLFVLSRIIHERCEKAKGLFTLLIKWLFLLRAKGAYDISGAIIAGQQTSFIDFLVGCTNVLDKF